MKNNNEENYKAGWIKLYRSFASWGWYKKANMVHLFIHLLLTANHKDGEWEGITILRGQVATGRKSLSEKTGISEQKIRTCLTKLQQSNEITLKSTSKYSIITLCNYGLYQDTQNETNQQLTSNQPATNQQLTTNKNLKNVKNVNNKKHLVEQFESFWNLYPKRKGKKVGKQVALNMFIKLNFQNGEYGDLMRAVRNYSDEEYPKDAERFLKNEYWRDWVTTDDSEVIDSVKEYNDKIKKEIGL